MTAMRVTLFGVIGIALGACSSDERDFASGAARNTTLMRDAGNASNHKQASADEGSGKDASVSNTEGETASLGKSDDVNLIASGGATSTAGVNPQNTGGSDSSNDADIAVGGDSAAGGPPPGGSSSASGGDSAAGGAGGTVSKANTGGAESSGGAATGGVPSTTACTPACPEQSQCVEGECQCDGALAYCGGQCVDTQTDAAHCGSGCGVACVGDQTCADGECTCGADYSLCSSSCVDTDVDPNHCGGCDKPCDSPRSCTGGSCMCPSGLEYCSPNCVDLQTDLDNCGACGNACQGAQECVGRSCEICSTGCAVLTTNIIEASVQVAAKYDILLDSPVNLAGATITARVYVASSLKPQQIQIHFDDTTDSSSAGTSRAVDVPASGWFDVDIEVSDTLPFASSIDSIGLIVGTFTEAGTNILYLDSIRVSSGDAGPWDFTSDASSLAYSFIPDSADGAVNGSIGWRGN